MSEQTVQLQGEKSGQQSEWKSVYSSENQLTPCGGAGTCIRDLSADRAGTTCRVTCGRHYDVL